MTIGESILLKIKDRVALPDRTKDKGVINPETGSSILINNTGNVTIASSNNVQYKLNYSSGQAKEVSLESKTITNRKTIKTDEIVVNGHKLNPYIYDLTDMKELYADPNLAIGNLTMGGYVLVKTWEPTLERWVLIRRPMRTPLFFNNMPIAKSPVAMAINDSISKVLEEVTE